MHAGANLKTIARSMPELSQLTLPEIDAVAELVGKLVPAGNVPAVILSGAARLKDRIPPPHIVRRDIHMLFTGVENVLDKAAYWGFFGGPAAVLWGYQNILKLAGKDPVDAFPRGTWQFYVDYALREDTARHATETYGFDYRLRQSQIDLAPGDRITAWTMTAIYCLRYYRALLAIAWRERVYLTLLREVTADLPAAAHYAGLYRRWLKHRPYGRAQDAAPEDTYPIYRRKRFDRFLAEATRSLPDKVREGWRAQIEETEARELEDYQDQMSILAYLEPTTYSEVHHPLAFREAHIGIIYQNHYYLIPAADPDSGRPADIHTVRAQVAALLASRPEGPPAQLRDLALVKRTALVDLRDRFAPDFTTALDRLRCAPILLNFDAAGSHARPLAEIRRAERGTGDHPLTLFDTGSTFVFDMSHIFFDGIWGAAIAEILTNEALGWARYLHSQGVPAPVPAPAPLNLAPTPEDMEAIRQAPHVTPEASAETPRRHLDALNLDENDTDWAAHQLIPGLNKLRRLFKQRSDLVQLTVNDLLILYRAIHAATYRPDPDLIDDLRRMAQTPDGREAAEAALEAIESESQTNPAVLIPVDAGRHRPRDRVYPMTLQVPLHELDLLGLYDRTLAVLDAYQQAEAGRAALYEEFDRLQRMLLATLAGLGQVLSRAKAIANQGESASVATIKLLAHVPPAIRRLLDGIPDRFDLINDIIKGREVFSNVGAVQKGSTLRRFITAKDDNDKKTLAWGILTYIPRDAQEDNRYVMHVSLRDFRPHVALLKQAGREDLAQRIAQDYLEAYVHGMNRFVEDLKRVTLASRETHLTAPGGPRG